MLVVAKVAMVVDRAGSRHAAPVAHRVVPNARPEPTGGMILGDTDLAKCEVSVAGLGVPTRTS